MPRLKAYKEDEVIEKAMNLFWKNGYETTSMHQLEKEMGINKFSIYSSFNSKNELLKECIKNYARKLNTIIEKLQKAEPKKSALKQYFYDFIEFSKEKDFQKGCLITNTSNELYDDKQIQKFLSKYTSNLKDVFAEKLKLINIYNEDEIEQKADYLLIAMYGFSSATKIFTPKQLDNYIDNIFNNL